MARGLSEIAKELLAAAEKSGLQEIVKIVIATLKTIKSSEKRDDIIKYLPLLLTIGEKPLASKEYITLCSKGLINRPKRGDKCPICLKGIVNTHSTGRVSWESSCSRCGFLFDED